MIKERLKGLSLFSSAGIGETYFKDIGIDIKVANELVEKRANLYKAINPDTNVICGDITDENIFNSIISAPFLLQERFYPRYPCCESRQFPHS